MQRDWSYINESFNKNDAVAVKQSSLPLNDRVSGVRGKQSAKDEGKTIIKCRY